MGGVVMAFLPPAILRNNISRLISLAQEKIFIIIFPVLPLHRNISRPKWRFCPPNRGLTNIFAYDSLGSS